MLFHVIGNIRFNVSQRNQVRHSSDLFTQGPCFCLRCGLQLHLIRRARFPQSTRIGQWLNSSTILIRQAAAASPLVQGYPGKVCFSSLVMCYCDFYRYLSLWLMAEGVCALSGLSYTPPPPQVFQISLLQANCPSLKGEWGGTNRWTRLEGLCQCAPENLGVRDLVPPLCGSLQHQH